MVFPTMYSKLWYNLTNVETARINKVLIIFVHRFTLRKTSIFSKRLRKICFLNYSQTRLNCAVFRALSSDVQYIGAQAHKREKSQGLIKC
jgi:hypothetical protein